MNSLRRAVAQIAYSQSATKRVVLHPTALLTKSYSTKQSRNADEIAGAPKVDDWPRPSEIPFQVKVANSVNLIGYVDSPVQFQSSSDGKHWAGTVITQNASGHSPHLWIPVVFEGDLAHIAACHLKKNDHVHIAGQLTADPPPPTNSIYHAIVQVMVRSINFIEPSSQMSKPFASKKQEDATIGRSASMTKDSDSVSSPWRALLDNPKEWWDYRSQKLSGLVNPRYPDFKRKDGSLSLWLNKSSGWVLPELEAMEFDVQTSKSKFSKKRVESDVQTSQLKYSNQDKGAKSDVPTPKSKYVKKQKGEESWKDLVENPKNWWDNRLDKRSIKAPDFKHKESGEGLWLNSAPDWVPSKLPAAKAAKPKATGKRDTLLS